LNPHSATPYDYVDSAASVGPLLDRLGRAGRIALDTEADSLHCYREKVCLIQVSFNGTHCLIDPLAGLDLSGFLDALASKPLLCHGADYDLRMLRASLGFRPRNEVHDTQIAAQLLGIEEFGLAALADRFCGVTLSKASQKTNWARRPLTPTQLAYAVADTAHLEAIADALFAELRALGRYDWYRAACDRMVKSTERDRSRDPEQAWRIKGLKGLSHRELAFVREIWGWREHEAERSDLPPFMILGNPQIRDLAVWATAHPAGTQETRPRLPRNCTGRRLHALERALDRARRLPEADWPGPVKRAWPARPAPDTDREVNELMKACARIAADLQIAPPMLAPRAMLEAIVARRPRTFAEILECSPMLPWQAELLAPAILKTLGGEAAKE